MRMVWMSFLVGCGLLLAGCETTNTAFDVDVALATEPELESVRMGDRFAVAVDFVGEAAAPGHRVSTGEWAKRIFTGSDGAAWELELVGSSLSGIVQDNFPVPIWITSASYDGTFVLASPDGEKYTLQAVGTATESKTKLALDGAVARGLADLAGKVSALMADLR